MKTTRRAIWIVLGVLCWDVAGTASTANGPFVDGQFQGRIAYSCDGNHNDPDDWIASPVTLAILAEAGLKDRLVHFDYNCILPLSDPGWERIHAESVLGTADRYGFDKDVFFDCRKDRDGAVASIAKAINESGADNPLYLIIAGPMEVPYLGIQQSDPARRQFVYCISHSRWNDGFASKYKFTFTKRSVIEQDVHWVQIRDQNRLLSFGRYGRPSKPEEFEPYFWMRNSDDANVRWLWERMIVSTRPDPSDAGMTYFLVSGDEECDPVKLKRLIEEHRVPTPTARRTMRIEAENFRHLEGCSLEDRNDKQASHALNTRLAGGTVGRIRTRFDEPFTENSARYDVEVRYFDAKNTRCRFALSAAGVAQGAAWESPGEGLGWSSQTIRDVTIRRGDEIAVELEAGGEDAGKLDYLQLNCRSEPQGTSPVGNSAAVAAGSLDDPDALPGQVIVAGRRPGYLKYNGGGPVFLCGPDNPEDFLFLGTLNQDGTRSGGRQEELIEVMAKAKVNAFHCQMFRMRRCNIKDEGDDQHCPFVDFDPAKPLNERVLDQWESWLKRMEEHGIIVHLEFYNDATDVERMGWKLAPNGELHPDEAKFFTGIVARFKQLKNVIWGIEESVNKLPRARTPHFMKLSELIARVDNHHHPIVHSFVSPDTSERDAHPDNVTGADFISDPNVHITTWLHALPHGEDYEAQHREYLKYARMNNDRFIVMKNETERFPRTQPQSRRYMWACAMAGMHALEAGHDVVKRAKLLADDGRIRSFIEQTDFQTMQPRDDLAAGSARWVLANAGTSYIVYTYDCTGPMGLKELTAGTYDLLWFDTTNGRTVKQPSVSAVAGDATWPKPESLGTEIALYVRRQN